MHTDQGEKVKSRSQKRCRRAIEHGIESDGSIKEPSVTLAGKAGGGRRGGFWLTTVFATGLIGQLGSAPLVAYGMATRKVRQMTTSTVSATPPSSWSILMARGPRPLATIQTKELGL